jgi:NADH-quinone oxidoreductase subunit C
MMQAPVRIDAADWTTHLQGLQAQGYRWFDFLTAIDRGAGLDIVVRVMQPESGESALVTTRTTDELPSLTAIYPGARWYERETREMFGITFTGLDDDRPLLVHAADATPPLRKPVSP